MSVDPALLAEVVARPTDDAPRLAIAARLTAAGYPRGELISAQCLLAGRGLAPPRRLELQRRANALLAEYGAAWASHVGGASYTFRRGFIDEVDADAATLLPVAGNLFATEPVTRLVVRQAAGLVLALANANAFTRVLRLTVRGPIGDDGARVLASALARRDAPLESLNLGSCDIGGDGAVALAPALTGCRTLSLTGNTIGDDGLAALAGSRALASLASLYVSDNDITDEGLTALAKGGLSSLSRLAVARNEEVTSSGLAAVAKSKKLKQLRWLEYDNADEGRQMIATRT